MTQQQGRRHLAHRWVRPAKSLIQRIATRANPQGGNRDCSTSPMQTILADRVTSRRYSDDELFALSEDMSRDSRSDRTRGRKKVFGSARRTAGEVSASEQSHLVSRAKYAAEAMMEECLTTLARGLPDQQYRYLLLHINGGLTYHEIAEECSVDEEVVLKQLAKAYSFLSCSMWEAEMDANELRPRVPQT